MYNKITFKTAAIRFVLFIYLALVTIVSNSQDVERRDATGFTVADAPFDPQSSFNTFVIKGKILPWVMGNNGGLNGTLGIEQSIFKRTSIGFEGFFHRWAEHFDNDSGYSDDAYHRDKALVTSFRFYYGNEGEKRLVNFYNGLSWRYGRLYSYWDKALAENNRTERIKNYNSFGLLTGLYFGFKEYHQFGIDFNTGVFYNMKKITSIYSYYPGTGQLDTFANTWDFRIGFDFIWWFAEKRDLK